VKAGLDEPPLPQPVGAVVGEQAVTDVARKVQRKARLGVVAVVFLQNVLRQAGVAGEDAPLHATDEHLHRVAVGFQRIVQQRQRVFGHGHRAHQGAPAGQLRQSERLCGRSFGNYWFGHGLAPQLDAAAKNKNPTHTCSSFFKPAP
jgi:hypothetical protein